MGHISVGPLIVRAICGEALGPARDRCSRVGVGGHLAHLVRGGDGSRGRGGRRGRRGRRRQEAHRNDGRGPRGLAGMDPGRDPEDPLAEAAAVRRAHLPRHPAASQLSRGRRLRAFGLRRQGGLRAQSVQQRPELVQGPRRHPEQEPPHHPHVRLVQSGREGRAGAVRARRLRAEDGRALLVPDVLRAGRRRRRPAQAGEGGRQEGRLQRVHRPVRLSVQVDRQAAHRPDDQAEAPQNSVRDRHQGESHDRSNLHLRCPLSVGSSYAFSTGAVDGALHAHMLRMPRHGRSERFGSGRRTQLLRPVQNKRSSLLLEFERL